MCKSTTKITFSLSHSMLKFNNCFLRVSSGLAVCRTEKLITVKVEKVILPFYGGITFQC